MPHWPEGSGPVDVEVRLGDVPDELPGYPELWGGAFVGRGDRCLLRYQDVGRILIESGTRVTCAVALGGSHRALGTALSSVGFAALLSQRGRICLHASAAEKDGRAFLIAGPSGVGKSTIVTALLERGYRMVSDDITVIDRGSDGNVWAVPSFPAVRLLSDSVEVLQPRGGAREGVDRLDDKVRQRFDEHFVSHPVKVARISRMLTGEIAEPLCAEVTGPARFLALQRILMRPNMARLLADPTKLDHALMQMAATVAFCRVIRPERGFHLDTLCRLIAG